ncbi:PAS domain-containing sensor histidine kinase [Halobellus rarus]|uniref:histidine kinase n=1 Tax=Halobellus rarus TaxID=1126237 RepID=A0ABD6CNI3_9EURY|nr:PAS domain-containing sensor histidine kinase [Halobellus rarus]
MANQLPDEYDALEGGILLFDATGSPIGQNTASAEFLGYANDELVDISLDDLVPPENETPTADVREHILRGRTGSHSFEWQLRLASGEHRWVSATVSPLSLAQEKGVIIAEMRDLTKYKARGRRLRLLYRVLRHNLRNDMTVIQGYASNLQQAIETNDLEEQIEIIKQTAEKVGGFSESVANLERLIERDATEREHVDAAELVREIIEEVREEFSNVRIDYDLAEGLWISVDEGLKLAIEHTLHNAIKHNTASTPEVRVAVTAVRSGSYVGIRIEDNGPGIPEIELKALEGNATNVEHGNGLGLWLIRECTESLGGSVSFGGNDLGGTTVTIRVPRIRHSW